MRFELLWPTLTSRISFARSRKAGGLAPVFCGYEVSEAKRSQEPGKSPAYSAFHVCISYCFNSRKDQTKRYRQLLQISLLTATLLNVWAEQ